MWSLSMQHLLMLAHWRCRHFFFSKPCTAPIQPNVVMTSTAFFNMRQQFLNCHYTHTLQLKFHLLDLNPSTWTTSAHTHRHRQKAPSWESHRQIPVLTIYHCWCIFHPPASLLTPSLTFPFFSCLPDVEARRHAENVIVMQCDSSRNINIDSGWLLLLLGAVLSWSSAEGGGFGVPHDFSAGKVSA